jgi:hypothetical protein
LGPECHGPRVCGVRIWRYEMLKPTQNRGEAGAAANGDDLQATRILRHAD